METTTRQVFAVNKPSRSEDMPSAEVQAKMLSDVTTFFETRISGFPHKGGRGNVSDVEGADTRAHSKVGVPKLTMEMYDASVHGQILPLASQPAASEDFSATTYYEMIQSPAEHAKPGTGFIPLETNPVVPLTHPVVSKVYAHTSSNPATNDWIPIMNDTLPVSTKPNRSEPMGA